MHGSFTLGVIWTSVLMVHFHYWLQYLICQYHEMSFLVMGQWLIIINNRLDLLRFQLIDYAKVISDFKIKQLNYVTLGTEIDFMFLYQFLHRNVWHCPPQTFVQTRTEVRSTYNIYKSGHFVQACQEIIGLSSSFQKNARTRGWPPHARHTSPWETARDGGSGTGSGCSERGTSCTQNDWYQLEIQHAIVFIFFLNEVVYNTMEPFYDTFLWNTHERLSISRPWGQGMECRSGVPNLICVLHLSLSHAV